LECRKIKMPETPLENKREKRQFHGRCEPQHSYINNAATVEEWNKRLGLTSMPIVTWNSRNEVRGPDLMKNSHAQTFVRYLRL
jgi:hypothetical protein